MNRVGLMKHLVDVIADPLQEVVVQDNFGNVYPIQEAITKNGKSVLIIKMPSDNVAIRKAVESTKEAIRMAVIEAIDGVSV